MKRMLRPEPAPVSIASCYYPPRRTAMSCVEAWLCRFLRQFHVEPCLGEHWLWHLVLGSLIPGYSFRQSVRFASWLPPVLLAAWLGLAVFGLAWLGYATATLAFAAMLAVHAASCANAWIHFIPSNLRRRAVIGFASWVALVVFGYLPARDWLLHSVAMPLLIEEHPIVMNPGAKLSSVHRGDLITWHITSETKGSVTIAEGYSIARVLGQPGDRIRITPTEVWVNEQPAPRAPMMPQNAELLLGEKQWFAWPNLSIYNHRITLAQLSSVMLRLAVVEPSSFVGRPYRHWFGRRQSVP